MNRRFTAAEVDAITKPLTEEIARLNAIINGANDADRKLDRLLGEVAEVEGTMVSVQTARLIRQAAKQIEDERDRALAEIAALRQQVEQLTAEGKRRDEIAEMFHIHERLNLPEASIRYLEKIIDADPELGLCSTLDHAIREICKRHKALRQQVASAKAERDVALEEIARLRTPRECRTCGAVSHGELLCGECADVSQARLAQAEAVVTAATEARRVADFLPRHACLANLWSQVDALTREGKPCPS